MPMEFLVLTPSKLPLNQAQTKSTCHSLYCLHSKDRLKCGQALFAVCTHLLAVYAQVCEDEK